MGICAGICCANEVQQLQRPVPDVRSVYQLIKYAARPGSKCSSIIAPGVAKLVPEELRQIERSAVLPGLDKSTLSVDQENATECGVQHYMQ